MTIEEQIEALQTEFAPLWDKAMKLNDEDTKKALEAIKAAVEDMEESIINEEIDRWTAQFDANWDRIADNH